MKEKVNEKSEKYKKASQHKKPKLRETYGFAEYE